MATELITGNSKGIGLAIALAFDRASHIVAAAMCDTTASNPASP